MGPAHLCSISNSHRSPSVYYFFSFFLFYCLIMRKVYIYSKYWHQQFSANCWITHKVLILTNHNVYLLLSSLQYNSIFSIPSLFRLLSKYLWVKATPKCISSNAESTQQDIEFMSSKREGFNLIFTGDHPRHYIYKNKSRNKILYFFQKWPPNGNGFSHYIQ